MVKSIRILVINIEIITITQPIIIHKAVVLVWIYKNNNSSNHQHYIIIVIVSV